MKSLSFLLGFSLLLPIIAYAGWPTFNVLSPEEVMQKVITTGCQAGEGYIPVGTEVRINNKYIPSDQTWYWVYAGTSKCQKISPVMQGLKYMFFEQDGHYAGATLNTIYGKENTGALFNFTFTLPSEPEGWDCSPFTGNPPMTIGCARDSTR